jgi:NitT/TauT family transport system substrate-binding protein
LLATERTINERSAVLRRFASIVSGSWAYILAGHKDDAAAAIIAARPQAKLDPGVLRGQIDALEKFAYTDATRSLPFGTMAMSDWQQAVATLADGGLIDKTLDPAMLFSNELLDPVLIADLSAGKL